MPKMDPKKKVFNDALKIIAADVKKIKRLTKASRTPLDKDSSEAVVRYAKILGSVIEEEEDLDEAAKKKLGKMSTEELWAMLDNERKQKK